MAAGKMMEAWGRKHGIDKRPEFLAQQKQLHEAMDLQLYMKYFDEAHPVDVTDAELKKFYEEKKNTLPALMVAPGGVKIEYARFDSKDKAEKLFDKVKDVKSATEFVKTAKEDKEAKLADAVINQASQFGESIKTTVLNITKFPSVKLVKVSDHAYWVICAKAKSEPEYRKLDDPEVKQGLKKMLMDELKSQQIESQMEVLKKELNVIENHTYFDEKVAKKQAAMPAEQREVQQQMQQMHAQQAVEAAKSVPKAATKV